MIGPAGELFGLATNVGISSTITTCKDGLDGKESKKDNLEDVCEHLEVVGDLSRRVGVNKKRGGSV